LGKSSKEKFRLKIAVMDEENSAVQDE